MDRRLQLTIVVGKALFLFTLGYFVLDLLEDGLLRPDVSLHKETAATTVVILVPIFAATWWLFRKLRQIYSHREANAAALTFAVFSPISLLVAAPFATLPGNLAAGLLGPSFGLIGAFGGLVALTGVFILIPMALALWIARHFNVTRESERGGAKSR